ncbi:hypothetical protein AD45P2_00310 [Alteromonas phage vB_AmaP_AD45-P2]|uniref:Uncharacterized protein n=1 Tax=Pseudorhizobium pelagicum TaxID=1509405 RepID=A0A922TAF7_9HYPH|nr:hypothetical protein [Pseudorhizobium pelagicum]YP_008126033.1 hypothetical protein M610_gp119 [Alteromonas phage vB_AmaP_AD45-P1]AGM46880.1 hypothetical protein AD45P1_00310 [Alteromonas phage vB_AmaP_AD45-P1]AGM47233.1 hypothetical protein AD45P2_00310 [Alteromonas phage vB_AmaP_AD45-P2]KEQ05645.1 hypothetical protein GV68_08945 [Pseudorhizobium pelagicum]
MTDSYHYWLFTDEGYNQLVLICTIVFAIIFLGLAGYFHYNRNYVERNTFFNCIFISPVIGAFFPAIAMMCVAAAAMYLFYRICISLFLFVMPQKPLNKTK